MRDKFLDPISFLESVEKRSKQCFQQDLNDLSHHVVNNSNFTLCDDFLFKIKKCNLKEWTKLAIVSWYIPEEIGILLRLDLDKKISFFPREHHWMKTMLSSKARMEILLLDSSLWHTRDFFGNILNPKVKLDHFIRLNFKSEKVKNPQRKRGYHDHGSRVERHRWKESFDASFVEIQMRIEAERQVTLDSIAILEGLIS